jgi:DNA/RNA-binding domain of Phe-tRNA-synthetase-like protein
MSILQSKFDGDLIPCTELTFTSRTAFTFDFTQANWHELERIIAQHIGDISDVHQGYRDLRTKLGIGWRNRIPAPVRLSGRIDRLAQVPDIIRAYNRISGWSGLALGMHDIQKLVGGRVVLDTLESRIQFFRVDGKESYGEPGEYGYQDADGLICRLEVMQCQRTAVSTDTSDFLLIFQGNPNTPLSYLEAVRQWTRSMLTLCPE